MVAASSKAAVADPRRAVMQPLYRLAHAGAPEGLSGMGLTRPHA